MKSMSFRAFWTLLGMVVLSVSTAASPKVRSSYSVFDLGTLPGGDSSQANDINDRGQVVGSSLVDGTFRPFLWQNGTMTELPLLPEAYGGSANSINNRGVIVGSNVVNGARRAVMWTRRGVEDLGHLPDAFSCEATAINDRGQVVGACEMMSFATTAFFWERGRMRSIAALPGGDFIFPTDVNDHGQVVGIASNGAQYVAFGWWRGETYDGGRDGLMSSARAINNDGFVVGWSDDATFTPHAVVWNEDKPYRLGLLEGTSSSEASGINERGQITGRSGYLPFVWEDGHMTALPTLQHGTGIGIAINNHGVIVGQADNAYGQARAVIWVDRRRPLRESGVVWDFGPTSGLVTPGEGHGTVLFNASTFQNFADAVRFARTTQVSGLNVFTSTSHLPLVGTHYRLRILRDDEGAPGAPVLEIDVQPTNITYVGMFTTTGGQLTDVHRVRLDFPAVTLEAGQTYWIGASGFDFDAGLYGIAGPGDGRMMLFNGDTAIGLAPETFGDMMFQLISPPPPTRR